MAIISIIAQVFKNRSKNKDKENTKLKLMQFDNKIIQMEQLNIEDAIFVFNLLTGNVFYNDDVLDEIKNKIICKIVKNKIFMQSVNKLINDYIENLE